MIKEFFGTYKWWVYRTLVYLAMLAVIWHLPTYEFITIVGLWMLGDLISFKDIGEAHALTSKTLDMMDAFVTKINEVK